MSDEQSTPEVSAGAQEGTQAPPAGGDAGYDRGDYFARVEHEPDFAKEEIRKKDRFVGEVSAKLKRFESLAPYVDAVGPEAVEDYLRQAVAIHQSPELTGVVSEYLRTGRMPAAQVPELAEPSTGDPELDALKQELATLKARETEREREYNQRFAQAETRSLKAGIESNIDTFMSKYGRTDGLREKLAGEVQKRIDMAERAAATGDKQALNMLSMLHGTQGVDTLLRIAAPILLEDENLRAIASAWETGKAREVASQSTGAPGRAQSMGGDDFKPDPKASIHEIVRQRLEHHTRKAGYDPEKYWNRG